MYQKSKKIFLIFLVYLLTFNHVVSMEADVFVQSTVNRASKILGNDTSKKEKIREWKNEQRASKLLELVAKNIKVDYEK